MLACRILILKETNKESAHPRRVLKSPEEKNTDTTSYMDIIMLADFYI